MEVAEEKMDVAAGCGEAFTLGEGDDGPASEHSYQAQSQDAYPNLTSLRGLEHGTDL
jgi:hypothetical protein